MAVGRVAVAAGAGADCGLEYSCWLCGWLLLGDGNAVLLCSPIVNHCMVWYTRRQEALALCDEIRKSLAVEVSGSVAVGVLCGHTMGPIAAVCIPRVRKRDCARAVVFKWSIPGFLAPGWCIPAIDQLALRRTNSPESVVELRRNKQSLKADLKRSTAAVRKAKNISGETLQQLCSDILTTNLARHVQEVPRDPC